MHKTFVSFHHDDEEQLKDEILRRGDAEEFIDKSVGDGDIDPDLDEATIMRKIREEYLYDSTVTLVLVGWETARRPYINSEVQASLRDTANNKHNGLLTVIRDDLYDKIYTSGKCECGERIRVTAGALWTTYVPDLVRKNHQYSGRSCHFTQNDVYCAILKFATFLKDPSVHIDRAYDKRDDTRFEIKKRLDAQTPKIGRW